MGPQASDVVDELFNPLDIEEDVLDTCASRSWTLYFFGESTATILCGDTCRSIHTVGIMGPILDQ